MALEGLRSRVRDVAQSGGWTAKKVAGGAAERVEDSGSSKAREAASRVSETVERRAPATGLERGQSPSAPKPDDAVRRSTPNEETPRPAEDATLETTDGGGEARAVVEVESNRPESEFEQYFSTDDEGVGESFGFEDRSEGQFRFF